MQRMLKNKIAIVTGASKGIGAGIAKELASQGASVVVNYNSAEEDARRVVTEIERAGGRAVASRANVSKPDDVARLFAETERAFGAPNVLVNNAGIYEWAPLEATSLESLQRQLEVNVVGPFLTMQKALQTFKAGASIINISTSATRAFLPTSSAYTASKASLDAMTRIVAKEVGSRGIRVNAVAPGPVRTEGAAALAAAPDFFNKILAMIPLGRIGEPHDIAPIVAFLASDHASWISGEIIGVSGGA